jgi:hypothetical protein
VRLPFAASGWTSILIARFSECGVPKPMSGYIRRNPADRVSGSNIMTRAN